ncbi:MAG: PilZ domain-containing protein [Acidobacteriia bacterium]|nr:PilZ domain-containing protein [Terriglobia bacterium]
MQPQTGWIERLREMEGISGDRRNHRRYDMQLQLRWRLIRRRRVLESGLGQTIDLSSGGIRFEPGRRLPVGLNVELSISWPVLLHDVAPLQLMVSGRVVRSDDHGTAFRMVQHEFRTAGTSADQHGHPSLVRMPSPGPPSLAFLTTH